MLFVCVISERKLCVCVKVRAVGGGVGGGGMGGFFDLELKLD